MNIRKYKKIFLVLCVVLTLAAFLSLSFHGHADGHHQDCPACHFVRSFSILYVLAVAALITAIQKSERFSLETVRVISRFRVVLFEGRAPPHFPPAF